MKPLMLIFKLCVWNACFNVTVYYQDESHLRSLILEENVEIRDLDLKGLRLVDMEVSVS